MSVDSWTGDRLKQRCECELCRYGDSTAITTHNDESHDQSLHQTLVFEPHTLRIEGGTTKCARVAAKYFMDHFKDLESHPVDKTNEDENQIPHKMRVVEVGSGTGLVGMLFSRLGYEVVVTDMKPLLELLQANVYANMTHEYESSQWIRVEELEWGNEEQIEKILTLPQQRNHDLIMDDEATENENTTKDSIPPIHVVIGSDLIYAKETIAALAHTYDRLCSKSTTAYLIYIRRFHWEDEFFELMNRNFDRKCIWSEEDIHIYKFMKR
jgi:predicted nicotinamide N-methyase